MKSKIKKVCALALGLATSATHVNANTQGYYATLESNQGIAIENLGVGEFSIRIDESNGHFYLSREVHQGLEFLILGEGEFSLFVDEITGENYLLKGSVQTAKMSGYLDNLKFVHNYIDAEVFSSLPTGASQWVNTNCATTGRRIDGG